MATVAEQILLARAKHNQFYTLARTRKDAARQTALVALATDILTLRRAAAVTDPTYADQVWHNDVLPNAPIVAFFSVFVARHS